MENFLTHNQQWLIWLAILWSLPWKGVALWRAARQNQLNWFVIMLVINTLAILEILYIFIFSRRKKTTSASF